MSSSFLPGILRPHWHLYVAREAPRLVGEQEWQDRSGFGQAQLTPTVSWGSSLSAGSHLMELCLLFLLCYGFYSWLCLGITPVEVWGANM